MNFRTWSLSGGLSVCSGFTLETVWASVGYLGFVLFFGEGKKKKSSERTGLQASGPPCALCKRV